MRRIKRRVRSSKHALRKKRIFQFRIVLSVIFVVVILIGLSFWSKHENVTVHDVSVEGTKYVDSLEIKKLINEELKGSHFFLLARTNKLLIPRQKIKESLYTNVHALRKVSVRVDDSVLLVTVEEFEPEALWCDDLQNIVDEDTENKESEIKEISCYFVNNAGLVFLKEPEIHEYSLLKLHNEIEGDPIGQTYVSEEFFRTVQVFKETLKEGLSISINDISTEDGVTYKFLTKEGPLLLVDSTDDYVSVADNLAALIDQDAINEAQFSNINYIDLRFGNRVFYKLK